MSNLESLVAAQQEQIRVLKKMRQGGTLDSKETLIVELTLAGVKPTQIKEIASVKIIDLTTGGGKS